MEYVIRVKKDTGPNAGDWASYRSKGADSLADRLELPDAAQRAVELFDGGNGRLVVKVANSEHEMTLYPENDETERQRDWFVDVELLGRRWRYREFADTDDFHAVDELSEIATMLYPDVTKVWYGKSDGSEEYEFQTWEV